MSSYCCLILQLTIIQLRKRKIDQLYINLINYDNYISNNQMAEASNPDRENIRQGFDPWEKLFWVSK